MRLTNVDEGDIVHVDKKGRRFYAHIQHVAKGSCTIRPLDRRITYTTATSREVIGLYRRAKGSR